MTIAAIQMQERFDESSQDIYIWLSQEEFDKADAPSGYAGDFERLVNEGKRLIFMVGRGLTEGNDLSVLIGQSRYRDEDWMSFSIQINNGAWNTLRQQRWTRDRYGSGEKVTILIGDPDVDGLDAIARSLNT